MTEFIKMIENSSIFEQLQSSGSSTVYTSPDTSTTYQIYTSSVVANRIATIMRKLVGLKITLPILFRTGFGPRKKVILDRKIFYEPFEYLVRWKFYVPEDNMIAWNRITPLNRLDHQLDFIRKNLYKILYDISKGLYALHSIGVIHNDVVLDNVGIQDGNFVLFDFDGSGSAEEKGKYLSDDFDLLRNSIRYNLDLDLPIKNIGSVIELYAKKNNISIPDSFIVLEGMEIYY